MKLADEFSLRNFRLESGSEWDFAGSQWRAINPLLLLAYRLSVTIYCTVFTIVSIVSKSERRKWPLFITSLNYLLVLLHFLTGSCVIVAFIRKNQGKRTGIPMNKTLSEVSMKVDFYRGSTGEDPDKVELPNCMSSATLSDRRNHLLPHVYRIYWLFCNMAMNVCIIVVLGYWFAVYDHAKDYNDTIIRWYLRVDRHGINLVLLLVDFLLSRVPVRFLHFIYPSCFLLCYVLSNLIYWLLTHDAIYSVLDYGQNPGYATVFCVGGVFVLSPLVQFILYWFYRLKKHITAYYKARRALRFDASPM